MPMIGFGTWQIVLNGRAKHAVAAALATGYRLVDTAKIYGNEKGVGAAVRESGIPRSEIFVTTKLWNSDQGYDSALDAFDISLTLLDMDYIDLYLIHWPSSERRHEAWRALADIYRYGEGIVKAIGVSNYDVSHLQEVQKRSDVVPAVNQIEFHPYVYKRQKPTLEFCKRHDIVVEAYSPLAMGRGINSPTIENIARKHNKTNAQVMLRWALQHGTVPIPKSSHSERMKENLDIFDFELSVSDMKSLNNL